MKVISMKFHPFALRSNFIFTLITLVIISGLTFHACLQPGDGIIGSPIEPGSMVDVRSDYPQGPYGYQTGMIIENLQFIQQDQQTTSLADVHADYNNRLLLLAIATLDCTQCQTQLQQIENVYQDFKERGLQVTFILSTSQNQSDQPLESEEALKQVEAWQKEYQLTFPFWLDNNAASILTHYEFTNEQPIYLLIDVQSMKLEAIQTQGNIDLLTPNIDEILPQMIKSSEYPSGPYGVQVDQIIDNVSFKTIEGEAFTLNDIYQDHSKRLLLLTTSAEWCTACIKEQPELEKIYQKYAEKGLEILVVMFQDANFEPATIGVASNWKRRYSLSFPVVADDKDPSTMSPYYDISLTPMVMFVDLEDMRMIYIKQGFDEDVVQAYLDSYF